MKALKIIGKILLAIVSFVLCVALFASTLVTMLVADVKVATNKDNLQNILNQTLSAPYQQTTLRPMNLAAGAGVAADASSGDLSDVLIGFAFDSVQEMLGDEAALDLAQVKEFVEKSTIKEFLSEKSASIISDIYTGEKTTTITADEIVGLIEENKDLLKEHFDVEIPAEQIGELKQMIAEIPAIQQIQEEGIASVIMNSGGAVAPDAEGSSGVTTTAPEWATKLPGFGTYIESGDASHLFNNPVALALEVVRYYTSDAALWLCIGVCAVLIGLLFLCAWNKPYKAMIKSGITLFIASIGFLVPTLIAWLSPATWMALFSFEPMVGSVSRIILMLTGGVCGGVAGLGVALIAGGIVVCVLIKKKKAAALAAAALEEASAEGIPAEEAVEEASAEEATEEANEVAAEATEEAPVEEAAEEIAEEAPAEDAPTEETV